MELSLKRHIYPEIWIFTHKGYMLDI
jgi:hypothetical protein